MLSWLAVPVIARADEMVVRLAVDQPGAEISPTALGLSYETSRLLPDTNGVRYFRPDNKPLVQMFRTLGIKSLRIGGNSVDASAIPIPGEEDIRSLFEFAKVARVKVIYSVRLEDGDPESAAAITRFIRKHYAKQLDRFAIGNEPKGYYKDTNIFLAKWSAIRDAMVAVWPQAQFCGPDDNPSVPWCKLMVGNFAAPKGPLTQITQHSYSFGCSYKNPGEKDVTKLIPVDVPAAREKMLSPDADKIYEKIYAGIKESIGDAPVSFRMTEVNSYWFSGLEGASDRYCAALWAVDYAHWWMRRGAAGLNFHTGDRTGGAINLPCRYAAFVTSSNGYAARPLAYGLKLFSFAAVGRVIPVMLETNADRTLVAYACQPKNNEIRLTLINKAYGSNVTNVFASIELATGQRIKKARIIRMIADGGNIAAGAEAVRLGAAAIRPDGTWNGKWQTLKVSADAVRLPVDVPPASAAVISIEL